MQIDRFDSGRLTGLVHTKGCFRFASKEPVPKGPCPLRTEVLRARRREILRKSGQDGRVINRIEDDFFDLTYDELRALTD